jgi:hypothetical protein
VIPFRVPSPSVTASVGRRPSQKALELAGKARGELDEFAGDTSQVDVDSACVRLLRHSADHDADSSDPASWQKHAALQLFVGVSTIRCHRLLTDEGGR